MEQITPPVDVSSLPILPGVYIFKDKEGEILYVGKAKDIKKRVSSYFSRGFVSPKTSVLIKRIHQIDVICTRTEKEALLLEFSLIKKHRPSFNIVLRDDKAYLLFKLDKRADFPRLEITRRVKREKGCRYFGPYTSAKAARSTFKLISKLFPLRKCRDPLFKNRTRPCLQFYMNRCLAPCCREVDKKEYMKIVRQVELFLEGRSRQLLRSLEEQMWQAAEREAFEEAAMIRDRLFEVKKTLETQSVILPHEGDVDVVGIVVEENKTKIGVLFVRGGRAEETYLYEFDREILDFSLPIRGDYPIQMELLETFLVQFYSIHPLPPKVLISHSLKNDIIKEFLWEKGGRGVDIHVPSTEEEKNLMELIHINLLKEKQERFLPELCALGRIFQLPSPPLRIEAIDASHLGGECPTVGQVVFERDCLKKQDYRIYTFPHLAGIGDDYALLYNWAKKRYKSGPPWPDLLLIDGGKGQLRVVKRAFEELFDGEVPFKFLAIAKGSGPRCWSLDRIYLPGRKNPLSLKKNDKLLLFLQYLRDNVHRFVKSRMTSSLRRARDKQSKLEEIPGVGPHMASLLWKHFGSLASMVEASEEDLVKLPGIGHKKAKLIYSGLQKIREQVKNERDVRH